MKYFFTNRRRTTGWRLGFVAVAVAAIFWSSGGAVGASNLRRSVPIPVPTASCQLAFYDYDVLPPGHARTSFSASLDNVIYMQATWTNRPGSHIAHYQVYSPDNALYQDLAVPFTGLQHGSPVVWGALPIAGTWMSRLPGVWTVRMTLDRNPTVQTTRQFTLATDGQFTVQLPPSTPTNTSTYRPTPPPQLVGHVIWQGRPPQPDPLQALPLTLTLTTDGMPYTFTATTDASGNFTVWLGGLPAGNYTWHVKGPQYLSSSGGPILLDQGPLTTVEIGLQLAGDVNNDNLVDIDDFSLLRAAFGRTCSDPLYDARADFTGDCLVDIIDFTLLRANFGQAGARLAP
jgi:hypothetical protein